MMDRRRRFLLDGDFLKVMALKWDGPINPSGPYDSAAISTLKE
jgi:hypothetical protein